MGSFIFRFYGFFIARQKAIINEGPGLFWTQEEKPCDDRQNIRLSFSRSFFDVCRRFHWLFQLNCFLHKTLSLTCVTSAVKAFPETYTINKGRQPVHAGSAASTWCGPVEPPSGHKFCPPPPPSHTSRVFNAVYFRRSLTRTRELRGSSGITGQAPPTSDII